MTTRYEAETHANIRRIADALTKIEEHLAIIAGVHKVDNRRHVYMEANNIPEVRTDKTS